MPSPAVSARDLLILQVVVLVWSLTAVLGQSISLPSQTVVIWRTGIAALTLGVWLAFRGGFRRIGVWECRALLNGCLIGFHWYLFFLASRLGNVSVALTGVATLSLWITLLEPLIMRNRSWRLRECLLALAVGAGVVLVAGSDRVEMPCLLTGVGAAAAAAVFSIFNARIVQHLPAVTMSFYEMLAAAVFSTGLSLATLRPLTVSQWLPLPSDLAPLLTLALLCTVFAFSVCTWLQRRVPPFTIGIAGNLEPVYGMVLAAAVFGSREIMGLRFYAGAAIIIGCVIFHSLPRRRPAGNPN